MVLASEEASGGALTSLPQRFESLFEEGAPHTTDDNGDGTTGFMDGKKRMKEMCGAEAREGWEWETEWEGERWNGQEAAEEQRGADDRSVAEIRAVGSGGEETGGEQTERDLA